MLTQKLRRALGWIDRYQHRHGGISPTYREIAMGLGFASPSSVHKIIHDLVERGFARQKHNHERYIEILRRPEPEYYVWDLSTHKLIPINEARKKKEPSKERARSG